MLYKQCKIVKENKEKVVYIPKMFSIIGKIIKIKNENLWEDGWRVVFVSSDEIDESMLPDSHKEISSHRKKTGDSLKRDWQVNWKDIQLRIKSNYYFIEKTNDIKRRKE